MNARLKQILETLTKDNGAVVIDGVESPDACRACGAYNNSPSGQVEHRHFCIVTLARTELYEQAAPGQPI